MIYIKKLMRRSIYRKIPFRASLVKSNLLNRFYAINIVSACHILKIRQITLSFDEENRKLWEGKFC